MSLFNKKKRKGKKEHYGNLIVNPNVPSNPDIMDLSQLGIIKNVEETKTDDIVESNNHETPRKK